MQTDVASPSYVGTDQTSPQWIGANNGETSSSTSHSQSGENKAVNQASVERFKILNDLELKGLKHTRDKIQSRLRKRNNSQDQFELLKLNNKELESCYQGLKNRWKKDQAQLKEAQKELAIKDAHISLLEAEIEKKKSKKGVREEGERESEELQKESRCKKRKRNDVEMNDQELPERVSKHSKIDDDDIDTIMDLELSLSQAKKEIGELKKDCAYVIKERQALEKKCSLTDQAVQTKQEAFKQLERLKNAKEILLEEEQKKSAALEKEREELKQQLTEAKQAILLARAPKTVELKIRVDVTDQKTSIQNIEAIVEKLKQDFS